MHEKYQTAKLARDFFLRGSVIDYRFVTYRRAILGWRFAKTSVLVCRVQDGKDRYRCWFVPKGGKDYVSQKVPEDCYHLLEKMWKKRFARDPTPEELVWQMPAPRYYGHSKRKSPRLSGPEAAGLYADVSKLVNDSGLFSFQVKFRPHFFRHNLAVYLRDERKWDPREIQLILRHTSVETTTQFYFHDKPKNPEEYEF